MPGSTLRARSNEYKAKLLDAFLEKFGDALNAGRLKPIIDEVPHRTTLTASLELLCHCFAPEKMMMCELLGSFARLCQSALGMNKLPGADVL